MTGTSVASCPPTPAYDPQKFVGRQAELDLILKKADDILAGVDVRERVVIFVGGRGVGKTWLLRRVHDRLSDLDTRCTVLFIDLAEYAGYSKNISALSEILQKLYVDIAHTDPPPTANLNELARELALRLRKPLTNDMVALLIDHVYESDWALLEDLEQYLLGPLLSNPRALIVMTGRGPAYPFRTPGLRLMAQFWDLEGFPIPLTLKQLQRQATIPPKRLKVRAIEIYELSSGNPRANYLLASCKDPTKALDYVVDGMLEVVPSDEREEVRTDLEALCVVRGFDEYRTPILVTAYGSNVCDRSRARAVQERLLKHGLAFWNTEEGAYCLDPPTQLLTERYLWTAKRTKWRGQHRTAAKLYEEWAKKYTRSSTRWNAEAHFHRDVLKSGKPAN
jgi:hypothetical protein